MKETSISKYILRFFVLNGTLDLPGIGRFEVIHLPAINDLNKHRIMPPSTLTRFSQDEKNSEMEDLMNYLVRHLNVSKDQAKQLIISFSSELKKNIEEGSTVIWNGLGSIFRLSDGNVVFDSQKQEIALLKDTNADITFIRHDGSESAIFGTHDDQVTEPDDVELGLSDSLVSFNTSIILLLSMILIFILVRYSLGNFNDLGSRYEKIQAVEPHFTYRINSN